MSNLQSKLDSLAIKLSKSLNKKQEDVASALDKAVFTLPRLKNYFTKLEKSFKLLVNKQHVLLKLVDYYLAHPEIDPSSLCYTLKYTYGRSVPDEVIIRELQNNLELLQAPHNRKSNSDYDFNL